MTPKIVFMGSPDFALPTLRALGKEYDVVGVVTQPDRPSGRGRKLKPPPVKALAQELKIPLIQPKSLRNPEAVAQLQDWSPDLIVVAAFGQILRPDVLNIPKRGCINVHASLLPRWRGAAPIQAAILYGDYESGVTIMLMDKGLDTGPILNQRSTKISGQDTGATLSQHLSIIGSELLIETIPAYIDGLLTPNLQEIDNATYAPMLKKAEGELDFSTTAAELERKVRAFTPWPGTYTDWQHGRLKIHQVSVVQMKETVTGPTLPGDRIIYEDKPAISTADGILVVEVIQPAGKKAMSGEVFLRGAIDWLAS